MSIFDSLKSLFGPSLKKTNRNLIQIINTERAGEEIPKNVDIVSAYLKSILILPVVTGSQDFVQDKNGIITFHPDAKVSSVSTKVDDWQVFIGFLDPEAAKKVNLPSLARFVLLPFKDLPALMEDIEADGTAFFFHTNKSEVGLAFEQIKRIIDEPKLKNFEPEGLIRAKENYSSLRDALDLSFNRREQIYRKLETMPDVSAVWLGHLHDQNIPKYFIYFDTTASSKVFYEEIKPMLTPELKGEELMHVRFFNGFSRWIVDHFEPFYSNKKGELSGWGLDKFKEDGVHAKKQRPPLKKPRRANEA